MANYLNVLYFCITVNSAIVSRLREEESPDSTEQRTGEEPGVPLSAEQQKVPQKITTHLCLGYSGQR